ncbi:unnamed protein product [Rhizoctonia solani]|uniref:Thioesterase domain-containing protein n=1 Tax=Rhizoctonia solani TaxID=456999 RepID=A0A8H3HNH6_9AGAM|nr:unnamed protein product [Rhizoctonia solani]
MAHQAVKRGMGSGLPLRSIRQICSRGGLSAKSLITLSPPITEISRNRFYSRPSTAERAQGGVAEDIRKQEDPFAEARILAREYAKEHGYDLTSMWEENIAHLNNVHYVRFFETSRMHMMYLIGLETNGGEGGKAMLEGHGVSIILKSIDVKFKRPVTYPDNLVIMQRPHNTSPSRFTLSSVAYSLAQRAPVATSEAVCVWYDYDVWKKFDIDESSGVGLAIAKRAYKPERKD